MSAYSLAGSIVTVLAVFGVVAGCTAQPSQAPAPDSTTTAVEGGEPGGACSEWIPCADPDYQCVGGDHYPGAEGICVRKDPAPGALGGICSEWTACADSLECYPVQHFPGGRGVCLVAGADNGEPGGICSEFIACKDRTTTCAGALHFPGAPGACVPVP
jgi:hypothetical protein